MMKIITFSSEVSCHCNVDGNLAQEFLLTYFVWTKLHSMTTYWFQNTHLVFKSNEAFSSQDKPFATLTDMKNKKNEPKMKQKPKYKVYIYINIYIYILIDYYAHHQKLF